MTTFDPSLLTEFDYQLPEINEEPIMVEFDPELIANEPIMVEFDPELIANEPIVVEFKPELLYKSKEFLSGVY